MVVTPDGSGLLSASWDASVRLWQVKAGSPLVCSCAYTIEAYGEHTHTHTHTHTQNKTPPPQPLIGWLGF